MTRWLLGLLLAANVVLALWIFIGPGVVMTPEVSNVLKPDVGEILLLDELPPPDLATTAAPSDISLDVPETTPPKADIIEPPAPSIAEDTTPIEPEPRASPTPSSRAMPATEPQPQPIPATVAAPQPEPAPAVDSTPETQVQHSVLICGEIGPFKKKSHASQYQAKYFDRISTGIRLKSTEEISGYWVLIPALPDRQRAKAMVTRLKNAGITDLWLFQKGTRKNAISLGLFKEMKSAEVQQRNIQKKGFFPQISPLTKRFKRYWLEFKGSDPQILAKLEKDGLPKQVKIHKKNCKQASVAN